MRWFWPAIFLFVAVGAFWPSSAGAQGPTAQVSSSGPYPLLIEGEEVSSFPATASLGSQVCVVTLDFYTSDVERMSFQGWSHGPDDACVAFSDPGEYTARYAQEVLLTVQSQVKDYRYSRWVPKGTPVQLSVPEQVDERPEEVRYLFEEWTAGFARFNPNNEIVLNRPMSLEVKWTKEYFLKLAGPEGVRLVGQGWHKSGQSVVLKAPPYRFQRRPG